MTQAELAVELTSLKDQQVKVGTEVGKILEKVTELEAIIVAGGNVTPEVETALAALKAQAQATDELIPDTPV